MILTICSPIIAGEFKSEFIDHQVGQEHKAFKDIRARDAWIYKMFGEHRHSNLDEQCVELLERVIGKPFSEITPVDTYCKESTRNNINKILSLKFQKDKLQNLHAKDCSYVDRYADAFMVTLVNLPYCKEIREELKQITDEFTKLDKEIKKRPF